MHPYGIHSTILAVIISLHCMAQVSLGIETSDYNQAIDLPDFSILVQGEVLPVAQSTLSYDGEDAIAFGPHYKSDTQQNNARSSIQITIYGPTTVSWITKGPVATFIKIYDENYGRLIEQTELEDGWILNEFNAKYSEQYEFEWNVDADRENSDEAIIGYLDKVNIDLSPIISSQPSDTIERTGNSAKLQVAIYHATPDTLYQWRENGEDIEEATQASLTIEDVSPSDLLKDFDVIIVTEHGTVTSLPTKITDKTKLSQSLDNSDLDFNFTHWIPTNDSESVGGSAAKATGPSWEAAELHTTVQGPVKIRYAYKVYRGEISDEDWLTSIDVSLEAKETVDDSSPSQIQYADTEVNFHQGSGWRSLTAIIPKEGSYELTLSLDASRHYEWDGFDIYPSEDEEISVLLDYIKLIYIIDDDGDETKLLWPTSNKTIGPPINFDESATYQWLKNGLPIEGATNQTLSFLSDNPTPGIYRLQAQSGGKTYESSATQVFGALHDDDFDGLPNSLEIALRTSPSLKSQNLHFHRVFNEEWVVDPNGYHREKITYWKPYLNIPNTLGDCDCTVVVEGSYDLINWVELTKNDIGYRYGTDNSNWKTPIPFVRYKLTH